MGNNILLGALDSGCWPVFVDECSHYSLFEAVRLGGRPNGAGNARPAIAFHHRDAGDLRAKLKERLEPGDCPLVLSDGVFAATGRIAPAAEYFDILRDYPGSALCLDDAHGVGVLGENGRGTFEHLLRPKNGANKVPGRSIIQANISNSVFPCPALPCPALLFCATLSKAVGGFGGIIPGGREFIDRLKTSSPYFGGASAPPTPIAAATARALEIVAAEPGLRTRLRSNARLLKDGLRRMGFDVDDAPTPVACLAVGTAENMQRIQRELLAQGMVVAYMASYAGLGPEGGLRIAVFATHTEEMIGRLLDGLRQLA
jgi:7-keto-8-aminopelargonate synthetase-like enzyme